MLPSQILAERARLPVGFLEQVIEYRAYASAVLANEIDPKGRSSSPLRMLATQIELDLAAEDTDGD